MLTCIFILSYQYIALFSATDAGQRNLGFIDLMVFVPVDLLFQHFEDLVAGHFRERGHAILAACKYYMEGHEVGSKVPEEDEDTKGCQNGEGSSSSTTAKPQQNKPALRTNRNASFKTNLEVLFEELLMEFNVKGANTARFRAEKLKNQLAAA